MFSEDVRAVYPWSTHRWKVVRNPNGTPEVSVCQMCDAVKTVWNAVTVIVEDSEGNRIEDDLCKFVEISDTMEE